jgi:hypothetical protein
VTYLSTIPLKTYVGWKKTDIHSFFPFKFTDEATGVKSKTQGYCQLEQKAREEVE